MKLLTVKQVAEFLSVSRSLVYQLVERGDLPYVAVGTSKAYRFDLDDLEEYVRQRKQQKVGGKPRLSRPQLKHIKL